MATSPLFNENKLKLGFFTFNGVGQLLMDLPPREVNWPATLRIARIADEAGFEALVPYARWKGIVRDPSLPFLAHDVFEPFTWAAGLAQATSYPAIFATTHVPMMHPIVVAKMAATIDHISGGRFAMNVVAGWNAPEFTMFGEPLREHTDRYAQAAEWMDIIVRLWTEREFDVRGTYYTIERGESFPKPLQQPGPPIMNAGGSDAGRAFATRYAHLCFVMLGNDPSVGRELIELYRADAAKQGREIAIWVNSDVTIRDTDDEAQHYKSYLLGSRNPLAMAAFRATRDQGAKPVVLPSGRGVGALDGQGSALIGSPDTVVRQIVALHELGVDGIVMHAYDFEEMAARVARDVVPRLEALGLRKPFRKDAA